MNSESNLEISLSQDEATVLIMSLLRAKFSLEPDKDLLLSPVFNNTLKSLIEEYVRRFPHDTYIESLVGKKILMPFSEETKIIMGMIDKLAPSEKEHCEKVAFYPYEIVR